MIAADFIGIAQGEKARKIKTLGGRLNASERIIAAYAKKYNDLAKRLTDGKISIGDWQLEMRRLLRREYTMQLVAAAGNIKGEIDPADYLKLGTRLREQYRYLEQFANDIRDKNLTLGQIQMRARMYGTSSRQAFWEQITGGVELPAYPGDGSTQCRTNCKCSWDIKYIRDKTGLVTFIEAYWKLGAAEHCPDCVKRADTWKPLRIAAANARLSPMWKELSRIVIRN